LRAFLLPLTGFLPLIGLLPPIGSFLHPRAVETAFEIRTVEEALHRGDIAGLSGTRLEVATSSGTVGIDCRDVLCATAIQPPVVGPSPSSLLELADGDVLFGTVDSGKGDVLSVHGPGEGLLEVAVGSLRRWIHLGNAAGRSAESFAPAPDADRLYLPAPGGLDHLDGTLSGFDGDGFTFESALGKTRRTFAESAALVLAPEGSPPARSDLLALVEFGDGSRLTGRLVGLEGGELSIAPSWAPLVRFRLDRVASIRFRNGRYVYLSELEPIEAVETPYFGGADALRFPYQKDRSVGGGRLRCGGRVYARGLGLHSRTVLRYGLEAKYARFRALAGIDDEVLGFAFSGSALLRIAVDGKVVYASPPLRAGGEPLRIPEIDLKDARELRVEADYGEDFHVGDRVDLLEPVLVRG
jgi:hypothetical protein